MQTGRGGLSLLRLETKPTIAVVKGAQRYKRTEKLGRHCSVKVNSAAELLTTQLFFISNSGSTSSSVLSLSVFLISSCRTCMQGSWLRISLAVALWHSTEGCRLYT